jgi:Caspase domain/TIR domain
MPGMKNAYALVIGVANYPNINPLPETVLDDARKVYEALVDPNLGGYQTKNVQLLLDDKATGAAIRGALANLANKNGRGLNVNEDSTVFFYVSSHGGRIETGAQAGEYLLPYDVDLISDESFNDAAISGAEFSDALSAIPARKLVVTFDCCHSSGIGTVKSVRRPAFKERLPERYYEALTKGRGKVILASSRSDEYSYVELGASNSLFTQHLLAGLRGGAPGAGGVIRIFDLYDYVQRKVTAARDDQHPIFKAVLEENFPIALYAGGKKDAAPMPAAPPADDYRYDAFISYRQKEPDKSWVRKTLVPALKAEGLRVCVDYECFDIGGYIVHEMERAVEQSRYTISVLTPNYLDSGFTEFEETLAQHLGLEERKKRYLGVMRESCEPSLSVRARYWLEMTDDDEYQTNLPRLVQQLRQVP